MFAAGTERSSGTFVRVEGSRQDVVTVDEVEVKTVEASQCPPARHFCSRRLFRRSRGSHISNTDTGERKHQTEERKFTSRALPLLIIF